MRIIKGLLTILFACILTAGCRPIEEKPTNLSASEADAQFLKLCKDDFNYKPILKNVGNTLWIYLPATDRIINIKASDREAQDSDKASNTLSLRYIHTEYQEGTFVIKYDIEHVKTYLKDYGYTSGYSQAYYQQSQNLLSAIGRAYFESTEKPTFIVTVVANIENGIALTSTIFFDDIERIMATMPAISQDEYNKRFLTELRGNKKLIGDKKGENLDYNQIALADFLARQITNRINIKYNQSAFPPSDKANDELLSIVAETLAIYEFVDFSGVILRDINQNQDRAVTPEELQQYKSALPPGGRYHVIEFNAEFKQE